MTKKPIDISNLDRTVSPASDFYHYANGGWLKKHPIPDEFSRYGTFDVLREENKEIVKDLIEEVAKQSDGSGNDIPGLVGNFYKTGMNTDLINEKGYAPIIPLLEKVEKLGKEEDFSGIVQSLHHHSIPTLFYLYPSPDRENSEQMMAYLQQGGMGLSDVDYYRNDDERSQEIRLEYRNYIVRMFKLTGVKEEEAEAYSGLILKIESRLAHAGMTRLEQRDPHKTSNKYTLAKLQEEAGFINWMSFFASHQLDTEEEVNVAQPVFLKEIEKLTKEFCMAEWQVYFKWRIINASANYLSEDFEQAKFDFYGRFLSGKKSMQPRWKRVTTSTENALGEAIGRIFVDRYFPPSAKERMLVLVDNLRLALGERIEQLEWMSDDTKKEAREKLQRIRVKIGYPDEWRSYEGLSFNNRSYFDNNMAAAIFNQEYEIAKIGKPVDKGEWHMTPQTVNAYYHPLLNEIVFPAGILQPPFFYQDADDAVNYGAIGVVIGHEMTHGFDDQGRKFDKNGNLNDWWTEEDAKLFSSRAEVLEKQFNALKVSDDLYADGKLSLGENIADLGGINIAFSALRKAWDKETPGEEIDGFSPEQRFFLSYSHLWANNIREKEMIRLTKEDVHSLGINRVNGPLPNVPEFHEAFGVKEGDGMYLTEEERAKIW